MTQTALVPDTVWEATVCGCSLLGMPTIFYVLALPLRGGGVSLRIRTSDLAAIFEVYLLAVALGALKTAVDTQGPWFPETATLWVYGMTLVGSAILVSTLALAGIVLTRPPQPGSTHASTTTTNPHNAQDSRSR